MDADPESPLARAQAYRAARRAFIAACDAAHVDAVARLNPARAADGRPLFMDAAALGPRLASNAVMAIAADADGSAIAAALLREPIALPPDTRLVLVHALDPARFAGATGDPAWPAAMLAVVAGEDMSRVANPRVLALGGVEAGQRVALATAKLQTAVTILPPAASLTEAQAALAGFFQR
ncbi:MAG TPA: DUF2817 domain-containing protein [Rhizomicrobium sp.]|jgi:hypothetical protein